MAGRTSQTSRRAATTARGSTRRTSAKAAKSTARGRGRTAQARKTRASGRPLARQRAAQARRRQLYASGFGLVGQAVGGLWMGIAHSFGWVARSIGRQAASARELDEEHRRDGGGLLR